MNFKLKNKRYLTKLIKLLKEYGVKQVDEKGFISFTSEEIYYMAKASGLKSNKKRHLIKRFRLIINEAISNMLKELDGKNQS